MRTGINRVADRLIWSRNKSRKSRKNVGKKVEKTVAPFPNYFFDFFLTFSLHAVLTKPEKTVGMVNKQSKGLRTGGGKTQGHVSATKSCVYLL